MWTSQSSTQAQRLTPWTCKSWGMTGWRALQKRIWGSWWTASGKGVSGASFWKWRLPAYWAPTAPSQKIFKPQLDQALGNLVKLGLCLRFEQGVGLWSAEVTSTGKKKKDSPSYSVFLILFFPPMLVNSFIQHRGCFNMKELFLGLLRMKTEINAINPSLLLLVYKAVQITCVNALFISFFLLSQVFTLIGWHFTM